MKIYIQTVCFLLIVGILHFIANATGLYDAQIKSGFVWFDNLLHFFIGAIFAYMFSKILINKNSNIFNFKIVILTITFVIIFAIGWEFLELFFMNFFPNQAQGLKLYSPSLVEAFEDVISNIAGAFIFILYFVLKYRKV
jgi:hypothetical protein